MKSILKEMLVVPVLIFAVSAQAGMPLKNQGKSIQGQGGSLGSSEITAYADCGEYSDGMGGITIYGYTLIIGAIDGKEVYATESYEGLAACPDFGGVTGNLNQTVVVVVGGISVTAECTNQSTGSGSSTGHFKDPGQKPRNYIGKSKFKGTYNEYDGSCVITAINTDGTSEQFGFIARAGNFEQFQKYTN